MCYTWKPFDVISSEVEVPKFLEIGEGGRKLLEEVVVYNQLSEVLAEVYVRLHLPHVPVGDYQLV